MSERVLIFDNGGHTIKAGWSDDAVDRTISNGIFRSKRDKRTYLADEYDNDCADYGGINCKLPFERGILVNWDVEKAVWDRIFTDVLHIDAHETTLLVTEPVLNLPNVQESYDQLVFEEYGFASYTRQCSPALVKPAARSGIIIDSGFSATYIVPILFGEIAWKGVRRLDIGGKVLTNWMKELVSFRHWFMMDQTQLLSTIKEKTSFLSLDLPRDLRISKVAPRDNENICRYVLPDFVGDNRSLGYVLPADDERTAADFGSQQVLSLNNERFTVPEALYKPSLIGLMECGLAEAVGDAISAMPAELQGLLWESILCIGGNACIVNFQERLFQELRAIAPADYVVQVEVPPDPIRHTMHTARALLADTNGWLRSTLVTKAEYAEHGSNICRTRFGGPELGPTWTPDRGLADVSEAESSGSASSDADKPKIAVEGLEPPVLDGDGTPNLGPAPPAVEAKAKAKKVKTAAPKVAKKNRADVMSYTTASKGPKKKKVRAEQHAWKP